MFSMFYELNVHNARYVWSSKGLPHISTNLGCPSVCIGPTDTHQILVKNSANCCMTWVSKLSTASAETVNTPVTLLAALEVTVKHTQT